MSANNEITLIEIRSNMQSGETPVATDLFYATHGTGITRDKAFTLEELRNFMSVMEMLTVREILLQYSQNIAASIECDSTGKIVLHSDVYAEGNFECDEIIANEKFVGNLKGSVVGNLTAGDETENLFIGDTGSGFNLIKRKNGVNTTEIVFSDEGMGIGGRVSVNLFNIPDSAVIATAEDAVLPDASTTYSENIRKGDVVYVHNTNDSSSIRVCMATKTVGVTTKKKWVTLKKDCYMQFVCSVRNTTAGNEYIEWSPIGDILVTWEDVQ